VRDANKQAFAFVYCEDEPGRRATTAKLLTRDEAGRIAAHIAKLPEHVTKRQTQTEQGPPVKLGRAIKRTPRSLHVRGVPELLLQLRLLSWAAGCRGMGAARLAQ
jgi:hypothetical protein